MDKKSQKLELQKSIPLPDYVYTKNNQTIWGNVVDIDGFGVLILGKSQSGKSDFSLRIIEEQTPLFGCVPACVKLVCDDRVRLEVSGNQLIANSISQIEGLIEVYGLGIFKVEHCESTKIGLVIELYANKDIERLPLNDQRMIIENIQIPYFKIDPISQSSLIKLKYAISKAKAFHNLNSEIL